MENEIAGIPKNCYLTTEDIVGDNGQIRQVLRARPYMQASVVSVKRIGGMTEVSEKNLKLIPGTNTHEIHDFNVASGFLDSDEETWKDRLEESKRVSQSRFRCTVREYGACNKWDYFATITLNPNLWDRNNPVLLQSEIMNDFRSWKRKTVHNQRPYKDCAYLFIPECHEDGAIHLHGLVRMIPEYELIPYTIADVRSDIPLPLYICESVLKSVEIFHCAKWDKKYGYNTLTIIHDQDRVANYITKYITKSSDSTVFKTRCWHSRGLKRAEIAARYQLPNGKQSLEEYKKFMLPIVAMKPDGTPLQFEYYLPDNVCNGEPAGIKSIVDADAMSPDDVSCYLSMAYSRI